MWAAGSIVFGHFDIVDGLPHIDVSVVGVVIAGIPVSIVVIVGGRLIGTVVLVVGLVVVLVVTLVVHAIVAIRVAIVHRWVPGVHDQCLLGTRLVPTT